MLAASTAGVGEALTATGWRRSNGSSTGRASRCTVTATEVRVFTRNLNDVTARVPEVVDIARSFPARAFVLDGETIGVAEDALPRRFQDTMSRFGATTRRVTR